MTVRNIQIAPITGEDKPWITALLTEHWGSVMVVTRGRLFNALDNPGFTAKTDGKPAGLLTCEYGNGECEITSLNSLSEGRGIGTALLNTAKTFAEKAGCQRLWLITTNDNTHALRFYQKYGFSIAAIYPNALDRSRKLKPEIPLTGNDGIPLRDEIELEITL